ncbi:MAG: hypothetical protein ABSE63_07255 [Thermoguttaceae bacterium]
MSEALQICPELGFYGQRVILGFKKTNFLEDSTTPKKVVKKYPTLKGTKPLYGSVKFDGDYLKPEIGNEYHFVIDATGEAGYDRLYFDANRDLDLTNDPPVGLSKEPWPSDFWPRSKGKDRVFAEINVPMDFGPGYGVRQVKILPFMLRFSDDLDMKAGVSLLFVNLSFHAGEIKIGDKHFQAMLAQADSITGNFDRAHTNLYLMIPGKTDLFEYWSGSDNLCTYRYVGGKYYTINTNPTGDKLFVKPFAGDLGAIKLRPGSRGIKEMSIAGSLYSPEHAMAIGPIKDVNPEPVSEWQAPVGDYTFDLTRIEYGPLHMSISDNYHSDGKRRDPTRQRHFSIKIRKDKPFVLDFSNQPEVMFAGPAKDSVFKPGDEVQVYAVLVDPALDIMIRRLDDTRQKVKEEIELGNGKKEMREKNKSLDPMVTITDSSGKTVAEGPMPFG